MSVAVAIMCHDRSCDHGDTAIYGTIQMGGDYAVSADLCGFFPFACLFLLEGVLFILSPLAERG